MTNIPFIVTGIFALIIVSASVIYVQQQMKQNPFADKKILIKGQEKPPIWLYYDVSDVNSRWWSDFMSRSSRALNMPFLNLCYESIARHNSETYRIEVLGGLADVARLLGGMDKLPSGLQDKIAPVNEAELNWIRSALLARFGGLWLSPYTVCLKPFERLDRDDNGAPTSATSKAVFFGSDPNETYSADYADITPSFYAVWAPRPEMELFRDWESVCRGRIAPFQNSRPDEARLYGFTLEPYPKRGGEQIRGDARWDWREMVLKYPEQLAVNIPAELSRKRGGRRIQLEDILAAGTQGVLPFDVPTEAVYMPIPWTELRDREYFGWFLRMNEEQILHSDLVISYLLRGLPVSVPK
jgi:hypothetical protein